jgi:hypothetical protein
MRRHLLTILIFLLAGTLVNVAVAWGCVMIVVFKTQGQGEGGLAKLDMKIRVDWHENRWPHPVPNDWPDARDLTRHLSFGWRFDYRIAHSEIPDSPGSFELYGMATGKAGWPVLALESIYWWQDPTGEPVSSYGLIGSSRGAWSEGVRLPNAGPLYRQYLPTRLLWPGFTVNTFFYAAILYSVVCGLLHLRRYVRARRGLCPACAHPMGESATCTECGNPLPPACEPSRSDMRRHVTTILFFLATGALLNVAVAWGFAYWVDLAHGSRRWAQAPDPATWNFDRLNHWGSMRACLSFEDRFRRPAPPETNPGDSDSAEEHVPRWSRLLDIFEEFKATRGGGRFADARGWPLRSMCCHVDFDRNFLSYDALDAAQEVLIEFAHFRSTDGLLLDVRPGARNVAVHLRVLPLRPIWLCFAVNTLFDALILWLLILSPFALRRFIRRRRGLCPWCAYPVGQSGVCTECGKPLPEQSPPPTSTATARPT